MQGWLFLNNFWQPPQVKALLTAVPQVSEMFKTLLTREPYLPVPNAESAK